MKLITLCCTLMCCSMLTGCVEDLTADDTRAYQILARGNSAQTNDKTLQVISSQSSYDAVFYQVLNRSGTPETINFEQYQVLLVMTGTQQHMLKLEVVGFLGQTKQVQIGLHTEYAGANCVTPAVIRQPWMLVLFPRVQKPLSIQEQVTVTDC